MIQRRANVMVLLALASASLAGLLALECQAEGDRTEEIKQAKQKWLTEFSRQLMVEIATNEQVVEILKRFQATMPHDDESAGWIQKESELVRLIDLANVDQECASGALVSREGAHRYRAPLHFQLPLLKIYVKYSMRKQVDACGRKIDKDAAEAVSNLSDADKLEADVFAKYVPTLVMGQRLNEIDTFAKTKETLAEGIYRFMEATVTTSLLKSVKNQADFKGLFDTRMEFCTRIEVTTRKPLDDYLENRVCTNYFVFYISSETSKWIQVAMACRRLEENKSTTRSLVYKEFRKAHPKESKASKILNFFAPDKRPERR